MTAPFGNFRYSAGSGMGEFAQAAAGFAAGSKEEEERRRKAALEAALQKLKEREADRQDSQLVFDKGKETTRAGENTRDFGETQRVHTSEIGDRAHDNTLGDSTLKETERHNRASESADFMRAHNGKQQLKWTAAGLVAVDPVTQQATLVLGPDGKPIVGVPSQGEREAVASVQGLEASYKILDDNFAKVGYRAPTGPEQFGMDASKATGMGPLSSLERILANSAMSKYAPEYQAINNALDSFGSQLVKLMTGAQMSEPEAQRILNIIRPGANDPPALVQQKLHQARNIIEAGKVKQGRALRESVYGTVGETAPKGFDDETPGNTAPAAATPPAAAGTAKKKWTLPNGTVIDVD